MRGMWCVMWYLTVSTVTRLCQIGNKVDYRKQANTTLSKAIRNTKRHMKHRGGVLVSSCCFIRTRPTRPTGGADTGLAGGEAGTPDDLDADEGAQEVGQIRPAGRARDRNERQALCNSRVIAARHHQIATRSTEVVARCWLQDESHLQK